MGEAEPLMRRALEISRASFGEHHPAVATCLNNLAQLLQDTNRMEEAEPQMRRALEISKASFGEHHPTVATCLNNLAHLLQATNRMGKRSRCCGEHWRSARPPSASTTRPWRHV